MSNRRHASEVYRSFRILLAIVGAAAGLAPRVAEAQSFDSKIVAMDAGGENLRTLREGAGQRYGTPSLSADGKTLLYDMNRTGQFGQTHVFSVKLDALDQPAKDLGAGNAPTWSPDGARIAFHVTSYNGEGLKPGVWVANADGTGRTWLCDGKAARFSPDGHQLLFVGNPDGQGEGIYQFDLRTDEILPMLEHPYPRIAGAAWSPDGKRIAVIVQQPSDAELLLVSAEGEDRSAKIRLTADIGYRPNWSPDGKHLLIWVRDAEGRRQLHRVEVDSDEAPEKLANQDESSFNSDAIWSPDGKQILWTRE